jgi:hypothetical protein
MTTTRFLFRGHVAEIPNRICESFSTIFCLISNSRSNSSWLKKGRLLLFLTGLGWGLILSQQTQFIRVELLYITWIKLYVALCELTVGMILIFSSWLLYFSFSGAQRSLGEVHLRGYQPASLSDREWEVRLKITMGLCELKTRCLTGPQLLHGSQVLKRRLSKILVKLLTLIQERKE